MSSTESVYGAFVDYYGDLNMKIIKRDEGWVIYGAKVHSGLNLNRYIFVVVRDGRGLQNEMLLEHLDWVSFQTRSTEDVHDVPTHSLYLSKERKELLSDMIRVVDRNRDETFYVTDGLPIKVRLLHDPKKKNTLQYPDKAYLCQALETYRCVVDIL